MLNFIKVVQIDGVFVNTEDLSHCFVKEDFFLNYTTTNKVAYTVNTGVRDVTLLTEVRWYMWVQPQTIERLHLC